MRNARTVIALGAVTLALGGCNKQPQTQDQNIAIDEGMPTQVSANADIETLPADESSTTPSNQLQNGFDSPEANEAGNDGNAY